MTKRHRLVAAGGVLALVALAGCAGGAPTAAPHPSTTVARATPVSTPPSTLVLTPVTTAPATAAPATAPPTTAPPTTARPTPVPVHAATPTTRAPIVSPAVKAVLPAGGLRPPAVADTDVTPTDATCQQAVAALVADSGQADDGDGPGPTDDIFDLCPGVGSLNAALTPYLSSDPNEQDDLDQLDQLVVDFCTQENNEFDICRSLTP